MGPYPAVLRTYFCLSAQGSLLMVLGGPYGMPGIELQLLCARLMLYCSPIVVSADHYLIIWKNRRLILFREDIVDGNLKEICWISHCCHIIRIIRMLTLILSESL